jgi:histidyl-tRNA synthetase
MKIQRCKGSRDLSPEEMAIFRLIEGVFRDCCLKWGYKEVRTPTLEYLHLFTATGTLTPSRLSKVYSFLDWDGWSGERVVLRPDGTIPVARLYIDSLKGLARLFYVANIFIFEETGKENRERWQLGAELIGVSSPQADAELIMLALEVLKRLGLRGVELRLSHAGLIRALLAKLRLSPEEQARLFDQILDGDTKALTRLKLEKAELGGIDDFRDITRLLESLGGDYQIDIASGRGFEYYTGIIFQLFQKGQKGQKGEKLGGGGRYDALIPLMGGRETPASGFAIYLDPLMKLVKPQALAKRQPQRILIQAGAGAAKDGFSAASRLREAGYMAEVELGRQRGADFDWRLEVKGKRFILADQAKRRKFEVETINQVLTVIRKNE